jgi:hypothetical protein
MASARHPQRSGRFFPIHSSIWLALALGLACGPAVPARAQLPRTRLTLVTPTVGRIGATLEVAVSGADIDELSAMRFSHSGISAVQKMTMAGGKATVVANSFVVTIAKTVPAGLYDVRVTGLFGSSNPATFAVTGREVVRESEGNNSFADADELVLGQTIFGQINGVADVDILKFSGKSGQRVVIDCQASRVDSTLHAICEIYSRQGDGRVRLLSFIRRQVGHDPVTDVTLPADGEYFVKIFDERFAGSVTHTYLLTVHAGPHIDFVRPAAGVAGTTGSFTLYGRNLPGGQPAGIRIAGRELQKLAVKIAVPKEAKGITLVGNRVRPLGAGLDAFEYSLKASNGVSNPVPIYFGTGTMAVEVEPNNTGATAQTIQVPGDITGTLQQRGDQDVYEFQAKAGTVFWIEVYSQRIGAPADPYLIVEQVQLDKAGKETDPKRITAVDDNGTNLFANHFDTATDDPMYRFVAAADGKYRVTVRDRSFQSVGSTRHLYRLAIRTETHDFRVVVLPFGQNTGVNSNTAQNYGITLRKGEHFLCRALVFRRDGFQGAIDVTAEGLPKGIVCQGTTIGIGQSSAPLVFTATEGAGELTTSVRLVAKATLDNPAKVAAVAAAKKAVLAALAVVPKATSAIKPADDAVKKAEATRSVAEKKSTADGRLSAAATKLQVTAAKTAVESKKTLDTAVAADTSAKKAVVDTTKASADAKKAAGEATKALATATAADKQSDANVKAAGVDAAKKKAADAAKKTSAAAVQAATAAKVQADKATVDLAKVAALAKTAAVKTAKTASDAKAAAATAVLAKAAADKKAGDATKVAAASKTAFDKTDAVLKTARAKLTAARKAETDAKQAVNSTQTAVVAARKAKLAAGRPLTRNARFATIVQNGTQNNSAISRLTSNLVVSVMKEKAPFQLETDGVIRVDANRLRQILVPVKLIKRNGFDANVTLTWVGQPKNVQVANKPINKGKDSELLRIFLPNNAPIGTYALYLRAQGQVSYSRNPARVERAKAVQAAADKATKSSAAALKAANLAKTKADKAATGTKAASEAAAKAAVVAAKKLADAQAAAKKAADEAAKKKASEAVAVATAAKAKADKTASDAKTASDTAAAAKVQSDAAAKSATDKGKLAMTAKTAADKEVTAATAAAKAKNINAFPPSAPIIISIRENPATLKAVVPGGGAIKRGATLAVKVTITRVNGFTGPVTLSLPLPPGITDLKAASVTIAADKSEAVLSVVAGPKATEGGLANMVVRAKMQHDGREALVDQPITIKVSK